MLIVFSLLGLGLITLGSVTETQGFTYINKQLIWILLGTLAATGVALFDYKYFKPLAPILAVVMLGLLVGVLFTEGIKGSRRWFSFGPVSFQPSELAKLIVVILLAGWLSHIKRRASELRYGFIYPLIGLGIVAFLLMKEPDFGTTLLVCTVGGILLYVGGSNLKYLTITAVLGMVVFSFFVMTNPNRAERVVAWISPAMHEDGKAYQSDQSKNAFHAGGLWGQGYGQSMQKNGFVPEDHTDFIMSIMAEELGLLASLAVVSLFLGFFFCGLTISCACNNHFGRLLGIGVTMIICVQAAVNIGVVTGLLPTSGIALPFFSYGGSHILVSGAMVGVLISIARHADEPTDFQDALERNAAW